MRHVVIALLCLAACKPPQRPQPIERPVTTLVDHGIPVTTTRQWTTALSPSADGTKWNYISATWPGGAQAIKWNVVKDLTGTPSVEVFETPTHHYPNSNFSLSNGNVIRSQNGRIFFPTQDNDLMYYDPSTEEVHQLGPLVETPPADPNASTGPYSASFDTSGMLYFGTQESQFRRACISVVDPVSLTWSIVGYVGENAIAYTTYAYRLAPDTGTASKFIYVAYGQNPWQLWALNTVTGAATKLYEVTSTGNIFFTNVSGKGWTATIDTALGSPSNVRVVKWCIDGALYDYTAGVDPPSPRNVTPASNPLVGAPSIDISGTAAGLVRWRNGSSGPYNTVNYPVQDASPIPIESLVDYSDGVVGNTQSYSGFFKYAQSTDSLAWFGTYTVSRGPRLNVDDLIYAAGYPNGVLVRYNPSLPWETNVNPTLLGYVGLQGIQYAGIKYSDVMAWAPLAGTQGQLYIAGSRERNGVGAGIGAWKKATNSFIGTYTATGLNTVVPSGLVVLGGLGRVVMASELLSPPGSAPLFIFDYDLNLVTTVQPVSGLVNLGPIFETQTANVITGIVQGSGNSIRLWQYNIATQTLVDDVELPITGDLQPCYAQQGHLVYLAVGTDLVRVDVTALTGEVVADLTTAYPVSVMSFAGDGSTLFIAGATNSGVDGAQLFSLAIGDVLVAGELGGTGTLHAATLAVDGSSVLVAEPLSGRGSIRPLVVDTVGEASAETGARVASLQNDEGSQLVFGQPLYASGNGRIRLACADDATSSTVIGLVSAASIGAISFGDIKCDGPIVGTPQQWDAVCGTSGGLAYGTTYYLHSTIPGRLTATKPSAVGSFLVPVIRASSPTTATIVIGHPVEI